MALSDAIARLFGWRRVVVYDHAVVAAQVQGLSPSELYRRQPALRAVVSFLSDNVAGVPIKCYVREGDTDRPRDTESPLALLLAQPGGGMTTFELVRATVGDLKLFGQSLWYVCESSDTPSGWAIRYIPWSWVTDKRTWSGFEPNAFDVANPYTGTRATLDAAECVRFFGYHPHGTMEAGSPIEALKDVLSEQISAWEFRNGIWRNGGRVQQWVSRPAGADWTPQERDRWAKSWKERFRGGEGTDTGGTPILEDGMRLETTQLNAREAQWVEATRLTREDVAAVYHVNPSQIWHSETQTYASAKDNARALYADTLANDFALIEQRINTTLVPMLGMDPRRHYAEFDLSSKLAASFEEQASVLQSSVGGPWMTRNEARARMNLPALPGGDELIVPLNVTEGGLASPNDTDPTVARLSSHEPQAKAQPAQDVRVEAVAPFADGPSAKEATGVVMLKSSSAPPDDLVDEMRKIVARFVERQSRRVLQEIESAGDDWDKCAGHVMTKDGPLDYPSWWDVVRWDRELADDLEPLFRQMADLRGMSAMADIGEAASLWDSRRTSNFLRSMVERRAALFNRGTYDDVRKALMQSEGPAQRLSGAQAAFDNGANNRAVRGARTFATAVCGFATKEAVRQVYPKDTDRIRRTKTWRHHGSKQPRASHAAMDGETVGLDERFSNGADYPGDLGLSADESVNCHCTMDVGVIKSAPQTVGGSMTAAEKRNAEAVRRSLAEVRQLGPAAGAGPDDYFIISGCTPEMKGVIAEAIDHIPTDWLEGFKEAGIRIEGVEKDGRSHFRDGVMRIDAHADFLHIVHEAVHAREATSPEFFAEEERYFKERTAGKTLRPLSELDPRGGYGDGEKAYDLGDEAVHPYLFKLYENKDTGELEAFEIASYGVELMYRRPHLFKKDLSLWEFVGRMIREM